MYLTIEFVIGQLLHMLKRCDLILQSPKNDTNSMKQYARRYGIQALAQIAAGTAFFSGILINPHLLGEIWTPLGELRWNAGLAFFAGFIFDNAADWVVERIRQLTSTSKPAFPEAPNG